MASTWTTLCISLVWLVGTLVLFWRKPRGRLKGGQFRPTEEAVRYFAKRVNLAVIMAFLGGVCLAFGTPALLLNWHLEELRAGDRAVFLISDYPATVFILLFAAWLCLLGCGLQVLLFALMKWWDATAPFQGFEWLWMAVQSRFTTDPYRSKGESIEAYEERFGSAVEKLDLNESLPSCWSGYCWPWLRLAWLPVGPFLLLFLNNYCVVGDEGLRVMTLPAILESRNTWDEIARLEIAVESHRGTRGVYHRPSVLFVLKSGGTIQLVERWVVTGPEEEDWRRAAEYIAAHRVPVWVTSPFTAKERKGLSPGVVYFFETLTGRAIHNSGN